MHEFEPNAGVVLIVDDAPENLSLLSSALDAAGYVVLVARDGAGALRTLDHTTPDVILLDAVMPGMDGFQTCERIKHGATSAHVPVIFMTGLTDTSHVLRAFSVGAVDYITKPIEPDVALARVSAHVRTARQLEQVRSALEASGQAVMVAGGGGVILWYSSRAGNLLARHALDTARLGTDEEWRAWLQAQSRPRAARGAIDEFSARGAPDEFPARGARNEFQLHDLTFRPLARFAGNEILLAVESGAAQGAEASLADRFALTTREAQVLVWAIRGKTSRDIAQILDMSPRTVDKHVEHILEKAGAPSRSALIAMALTHLRAGGVVWQQ